MDSHFTHSRVNHPETIAIDPFPKVSSNQECTRWVYHIFPRATANIWHCRHPNLHTPNRRGSQFPPGPSPRPAAACNCQGFALPAPGRRTFITGSARLREKSEITDYPIH